jgi:hypothetical protein
MSEHRHIYGEIHNKTGMRQVFGEIRRDVDGAKSRPALTELYKRAGYLITLPMRHPGRRNLAMTL